MIIYHVTVEKIAANNISNFYIIDFKLFNIRTIKNQIIVLIK